MDWEKIQRIRQEIAAEAYESDTKFEIAADRLLDEWDEIDSELQRPDRFEQF